MAFPWKWLISLLLAAALGATAFVYAGRAAGGIVEAQASADNQALAGQVQAVWPAYHTELAAGTASPAFVQAIQLLAQHDGLEFRLYTPQGILLYTSGGALPSAQFMAEAQALSASGSAERDQLQEGKLRSFASIGNPPEGYMEIYRDLSPVLAGVLHLQLAAGAAAVALSALLLFGLPLLSRGGMVVDPHLYEENVALAKAVEQAKIQLHENVQFLANVTHELRTPLNSIIGFSDILKSEAVSEIKNPTFLNYITDINQSGIHLLGLINDILDFSKAEAGKLELEVEEVNASKVAANCMRLVQPRAEGGQVQLVDAMPKQNLVLETDAKKLKQVLLNLLSNAVKFTPPGGKVRIAGWMDEGEGAIAFQVSDSGVGIQGKDIAKALAEFGQVENTLGRRYEGTGLGLPLARKFIEVMGGKLSIQSEKDQGTTISFQLPCAFTPRDGVQFKKR